MLVFIRQLGCVFCKEALTELSERQKSFKEKGVDLILVHMAETAYATGHFNKFGLKNIQHISDVDCNFYAQFGLVKGSFSQLFGLSTWVRGYQLNNSHGFEVEKAKHLGDAFQMPGIFIIRQGQVKSEFIHRRASEKPDYDALVAKCEVDA